MTGSLRTLLIALGVKLYQLGISDSSLVRAMLQCYLFFLLVFLFVKLP